MKILLSDLVYTESVSSNRRHLEELFPNITIEQSDELDRLSNEWHRKLVVDHNMEWKLNNMFLIYSERMGDKRKIRSMERTPMVIDLIFPDDIFKVEDVPVKDEETYFKYWLSVKVSLSIMDDTKFIKDYDGEEIKVHGLEIPRHCMYFFTGETPKNVPMLECDFISYRDVFKIAP